MNTTMKLSLTWIMESYYTFTLSIPDRDIIAGGRIKGTTISIVAGDYRMLEWDRITGIIVDSVTEGGYGWNNGDNPYDKITCEDMKAWVAYVMDKWTQYMLGNRDNYVIEATTYPSGYKVTEYK